MIFISRQSLIFDFTKFKLLMTFSTECIFRLNCFDNSRYKVYIHTYIFHFWWVNTVKPPVTLIITMLLIMILSPALHHSEGFGSTPFRTDETLLQQPSISWNQGRKYLSVIFRIFFSAFSSFFTSLSLFLPPFRLPPALSPSLSCGSVPSTMTEWIAMTHEIGGWCSV